MSVTCTYTWYTVFNSTFSFILNIAPILIQAFFIFKAKSSYGISAWYIYIMLFSRCFLFVGYFMYSYVFFECCSSANFIECTTSLVPIGYTLAFIPIVLVLVVAYIFFYQPTDWNTRYNPIMPQTNVPNYTGGDQWGNNGEQSIEGYSNQNPGDFERRKNQKLFTIISAFTVMFTLAAWILGFIMILILGDSFDSITVDLYASFFYLTSGLSLWVLYIPQIVMTYKIKTSGSLSKIALAIEGFLYLIYLPLSQFPNLWIYNEYFLDIMFYVAIDAVYSAFPISLCILAFLYDKKNKNIAESNDTTSTKLPPGDYHTPQPGYNNYTPQPEYYPQTN